MFLRFLVFVLFCFFCFSFRRFATGYRGECEGVWVCDGIFGAPDSPTAHWPIRSGRSTNQRGRWIRSAVTVEVVEHFFVLIDHRQHRHRHGRRSPPPSSSSSSSSFSFPFCVVRRSVDRVADWLVAGSLLFVQVFGFDVHDRHRRRVHLVQVLQRLVEEVLRRRRRRRRRERSHEGGAEEDDGEQMKEKTKKQTNKETEREREREREKKDKTNRQPTSEKKHKNKNTSTPTRKKKGNRRNSVTTRYTKQKKTIKRKTKAEANDSRRR